MGHVLALWLTIKFNVCYLRWNVFEWLIKFKVRHKIHEASNKPYKHNTKPSNIHFNRPWYITNTSNVHEITSLKKKHNTFTLVRVQWTFGISMYLSIVNMARQVGLIHDGSTYVQIIQNTGRSKFGIHTKEQLRRYVQCVHWLSIKSDLCSVFVVEYRNAIQIWGESFNSEVLPFIWFLITYAYHDYNISYTLL